MSELFLLDTNAVISMAQSSPGSSFEGLGDDPTLAVSAVTELEVRLGVGLRPGNVMALRTLIWLSQSFRGIAVDTAVVAAFPAVVAAAVAQGQNPRRRLADLTIAATALAHGATLISDDRTLRRAVGDVVPTRSLGPEV